MSMWKQPLARLCIMFCLIGLWKGKGVMGRRDSACWLVCLETWEHRTWSCALIREIWGKSCLEALSISCDYTAVLA